jgi:hypothetical protein
LTAAASFFLVSFGPCIFFPEASKKLSFHELAPNQVYIFYELIGEIYSLKIHDTILFILFSDRENIQLREHHHVKLTWCSIYT